jgi:tRNA threonylcarbamoyl adenosine modification protein YjeE
MERMLAGPAATEALGRALGRAVAPGDLLALHGDLGAGKTTLVRGVAAGLGGDPTRVASPTFVLHRLYRGGRLTLHHLDLFRLGAEADLTLFDLDDLLDGGAVVVEWAELADLDAYSPVHIHLRTPFPDRRVARIERTAPARLRDAFQSFAAPA